MEEIGSLPRRPISSPGGVERISNNSNSTSLGIELSSSIKRFGGQVSEQGRSIQTLTKSSLGGELAARSRFLKAGTTEDVKGTARTECSMCGDVGFPQHLLLCKRCGFRFQHTYCSKFYPDLDMESWACEWCLYEVEKKAVEETKSKTGKRKAVSLSLTESRHKAFEFLLQIAQASPTSSSSTANNNIGDKRLRDTGERTKKENGLKVGNGYGHLDQRQVAVKEDNGWRLAHAGNWNCKEEDGIKNGAQIPKRQRCSHPNKTLDKWRNLPKNKLHCNTSKVIGRRYKLLADVLC